MIRLAAIFKDNMVIQREKNIRIFGYCNPEDSIEVRLDEIRVHAEKKIEGDQAYFEAVLPPMKAGGPYLLTVYSEYEECLIHNVMVGEVWLAGGQSNMELELQNSADGAEVVAGMKKQSVRFYQVPRIGFTGEALDEAEENTCWQECDARTVGTWSAVGYYFASRLTGELSGVTVGVIGCNWGGTSASCWMSEESLAACKETQIFLDEYAEAMAGKTLEEYKKEKAEYEIYQAEWERKSQEYYATHENPAWCEVIEYAGENRWPGPMGPENEYRPAGLYKSMLQRIVPYTLGGVIFYQGESDDGKPRQYYTLFQNMISHWREIFKNDKLPFYFVQLPMFMNAGDKDYKNWPLIREAQMRVYEKLKHTGIAVCVDCGEFNNIHPLDKKSVGERLADQVLSGEFGREDICAFGPVYRDYAVEGDSVRLFFDYAEGGFVQAGENISGFEIAGEDKEFYPAHAETDKNTVLVHSPMVARPVYVRYLWTNYAPVELFGKCGLPVAPFRTSMDDESSQEVTSSGIQYGTTV